MSVRHSQPIIPLLSLSLLLSLSFSLLLSLSFLSFSLFRLSFVAEMGDDYTDEELNAVIGLAEHNFKFDPKYAKMHQQVAAESATRPKYAPPSPPLPPLLPLLIATEREGRDENEEGMSV